MIDLEQTALDCGADYVYFFDGAAVLLCAYAPFQNTLSAFYIASNRCYFAAKRFCEALAFANFAVSMPNVHLKRYLAENGAAVIGKNTLAYTGALGSRFSMQLVCCGEFKKRPLPHPLPADCSDCGICQRVCPTGAITQQGFVRERCIRQNMSGEAMNGEVMRSMTMLLGCELCQSACPKNKHISPIALPCEISQLFLPENVLFDDGDSLKSKQAEYVGKNMLTRGRLKAQALVLAANAQDARFAEIAQNMKNDTPCRNSAAEYYLNSI